MRSDWRAEGEEEDCVKRDLEGVGWENESEGRTRARDGGVETGGEDGSERRSVKEGEGKKKSRPVDS